MNAKEKVAYLSGLIDGVEYDKSSKEGKIFDAILDALEEITDEMELMEEDIDDLEEFVEALDEDLDDIEEFLESDDDDDDDELITLTCPSCGRMNSFDPEILWESDDDVEVICPNCGTVLFSGDQFGEDEDDDEDDD